MTPRPLPDKISGALIRMVGGNGVSMPCVCSGPWCYPWTTQEPSIELDCFWNRRLAAVGGFKHPRGTQF